MTPTLISDARDRHSLTDVARRTGIPISAATSAVTVRCPLPSHGHPDRTPSMRVYLDDGHYYCFGCGARGDVIQWVRDAEGVGVTAAIRLLDSGNPITNTWAGVAPDDQNGLHTGRSRQHTGPIAEAVSQAELPDLDRTPRERVRDALRTAWSYYAYHPLHARGAAYLSERGIDVAVLEAHTGRAEVGHTPARPDGLVSALRVRGFSDDELVDAGLAYRRLGTNRVSDFYRQRVLMPLRDHRGELCGLIGRNVGDVRWPKYKNPPRTHAYDKSANLYQPLPAPISQHGQVVVVEGTLDALAIAVAAIKAGKATAFCPITQSGRELSELQIRHIIGLHPGAPVFGFDSDPAGNDSTFRYVLAFAAHGKTVAVTDLGAGHDPASWVAEHGVSGLSAWSKNNHSGWYCPSPIPATSFATRYIAGQDLSRHERMKAIVGIAGLAEKLPGRTARQWAERVAAVAGPAAVAEAHEHVLGANRQETITPDRRIDLTNWRPEPAPEIDIGFEAAVGVGRAEAFLERVAIWGRRLPRPGDPIFIRSASVAIYRSGILPTADAQAHLEQALGRIERSIDPSEASTPLLTTEAVGL